MNSCARLAKSRVLMAAVAVFSAFGARLAAQEKSWIGEMVLHTKPSKDIKFVDRVGDKQVEYPFSGIWPFQVREDRQGWLRIHDRHHEGWVQKADFVLAREAIDYFTRRIAANSKDSFALHMRGAAWLQKKEPDKAIRDFDACIALNPADATTFNNRGLAWKDKQEYDKAIADFSEAIRINPKPVQHVNRGSTWQSKHEYDQAIKDYDEAIHLDPKFVTAFYERGLAWRNKKEYDQAIQDYDEAIRLDPKYATAFYGRGVARSLKKEYDQAIKDFDEAIRLNPKQVLALRERGVAQSNLKEYAKALADLEAAVRLDPKYAVALADQAWLLATCANAKYRDGKKAVEAARIACEINGFKTAGHVSTLAAAYAEAGDFKEAAHWQEKAMEFPEYMKLNGKKAEQRLQLYQAGKAYHQGSAAAGPPSND